MGTADRGAQDIGAPGRSPVAMDRRYYVADDVFRAELERVFRRSWLFVGHESEIPEPGDYVVRPMGSDSVIVTRDEKSGIRVLLNTCMHRGNTLCKAAFGNTSHFRCSYHGWTYANDGHLRAVPRVREVYGPEFDKDQFTLLQPRVELFHGLVFATWATDGPSLREYLGPIAWYFDAMLGLSAAGIEVYGEAHRVRHRGNWKLPQENGSGDGYHLEWTHRTAFELELFGPQAEVEMHGHVVNTEGGHALRAQHPVLDADPRPFWGYPEERWSEIRRNLTPDQAAFFSGTSVVHGGVFPNCIFVHVAPPHGMDGGDKQTAFFQWRLHVPLDARTTEEWYWLFVPRDYPEEWKRASYKLMHRQHGAGAFFESDDIENFRRIDAGSVGTVARTVPFDYHLGLGVDPPDPRDWDGPGTIVPQDFSESNQRAFYRRYLELMEAE